MASCVRVLLSAGMPFVLASLAVWTGPMAAVTAKAQSCIGIATTSTSCDSAVAGNYTWAFDLTNLSGAPVHHLYILPTTGGVTSAPNHIQFNPPLDPDSLAPGLSVQVLGAAMVDTVLFRLSLHDSLLEVCCSSEAAMPAPCNPPTGIPPIPVVERDRIRSSPNPFNPVTTVEFYVGRSGRVHLSVFDVTGREIRVLHEGALPAGSHRVLWNGRDRAGREVASGVYVCVLSTDSGLATWKLVLAR